MEAKDIAKQLIFKGIVGLTQHPIRFKSGILSPMYINCRVLFGRRDLVNLRSSVLAFTISQLFVQNQLDTQAVIAGVAMGAVPMSAMLADRLKAPYCFVRHEKKDHGVSVPIEGAAVAGQNVVFFEDVVTRGESSAPDIEIIQKAGGVVQAIISIASYDFPQAKKRFAGLSVPHYPLVPFLALFDAMEDSLEEKYMSVVREWYEDPDAWTAKMEELHPELKNPKAA